MGEKLTHFDEQGNARMVGAGGKQEMDRITVARGFITINPEVHQAIVNDTAKKGDVLGVIRAAGIIGAKKTSELIPLCHVLMLTKYAVEFVLHEKWCVAEAVCTVEIYGKTGVEIEVLTGVQTALPTTYDICKAMNKGMVISDAYPLKKHGGKSGLYERKISRLGTGEKE